jgi:hypothetical protein
MRYALLGALLVVAGIAAQIEAARHHPLVTNSEGQIVGDVSLKTIHLAWSPTAFHLARIGGWALLTFGAVIVVFALVHELRR